jgi:N-acetylglucosamine kinase-like BadF-type ATPase
LDKGKRRKSSGWDWLADEGSAFWVGQKAFQVVFKDLDGRGQKTKIKEIAFRKFKIKNKFPFSFSRKHFPIKSCFENSKKRG